jgi:hypothetical protein
MTVETRPMKCGPNWPITHLNGDTAKSTTLLNAPGIAQSHWITGYVLDGLTDDDGFHLLRRSCIQFTTTDTWTVADGGTLLDTGSEAADGHMTIEMWAYIPSATGAHATLLKRGDPASDGWLLEITAAGLAKFTIHDSAAAATITGTTSVFDKWTLITVVFERDSATGLKIYVDGKDDQSTAVSTTALDLTCDGGTTVVSTGVSNKTNYIGPVGLYIGANAALSAATVLANYNGGYGRKYHGGETGLSLAWNNDEGTGTLCYDVKNNDGYKATVSGTEWVPSKQSGGTAAITIMGPPFGVLNEKTFVVDGEQLEAVGKFGTGKLSTNGIWSPVVATFPQAIKIGRDNPVRILETNGAFTLKLFGFTAGL